MVGRVAAACFASQSGPPYFSFQSAVRAAASGALVHGLSGGCLVAAGVAVVGAAAAAVALPAQPPGLEVAHSVNGASAAAPEAA